MTNPKRNSSAGGIFLAIGAIAGVLIGRPYGQTTVGLLIGFAAGVAIAALLWWRDRR